MCPSHKLTQRLNHPIEWLQPQSLDQSDQACHQTDITGKIVLDARSLDLHSNLASTKIRDINLADGSRGQWLRVEALKNLCGPSPKLLDEGLFGVFKRKGSNTVEQLEQGITVFKRQDIGLQSEHLAKF